MKDEHQRKWPDSVSAAERVVFHSLEHSLRVRNPQAYRHARLVRDLRLDGDDLSDLFLRDVERELGITLSQEQVNRMHTVQDAIDVCADALENRPG